MSKTAIPEVRGPAIEDAGETAITQEVAKDLGMTRSDVAKMHAAEVAQKARLEAEPKESIRVGRNITVESALRVIVNGVAYNLPIGVTVQAPRTIVQIARKRIEVAELAEETAKARSAGG